jgi:hypothetical protein
MALITFSEAYKVTKLLIMQSSPASCCFLLLRSQYSPHTLFSKTLNVCPSFSTKAQVSRPYKIRGTIILLYVLQFHTDWEPIWSSCLHECSLEKLLILIFICKQGGEETGGNAKRMGVNRKVNKMLVSKPEGKRPLGVPRH